MVGFAVPDTALPVSNPLPFELAALSQEYVRDAVLPTSSIDVEPELLSPQEMRATGGVPFVAPPTGAHEVLP